MYAFYPHLRGATVTCAASEPSMLAVMRPALSLALACATLLLSSTAAFAKPYVDTKKRFQIEMEAGWSLTPMPGDTLGMVFKKTVDGVPGILRVSVRPLKPLETTKQTLDAMEESAREEIG